MPRLDVFWSFRSPYSWLATPRLVDIERSYAVDFRFRPVRPLAMRESDFFERNRPQWFPYLFKDIFREGERLGVPILPPRPDPIEMDMATGKVAKNQPKMERLMPLALAAVEAGKGLAFAHAMGRQIWAGTENWHEDAHLDAAAREAGTSLAALEKATREKAALLAERLAGNETEQLKHHWGVPLMVLDDEPFFGQDRLDSLTWRMDKLDLKRR
jgi:2-hydroxychromene-2-carboxylate isomerase